MLKQLIFLMLATMALAIPVDPVNVEQFNDDCLFAHNLYRKLHGVPALIVNPDLSKVAMRRAIELAQLEELNVQQNKYKGHTLGETVGSVGGFSSYNGISATQLWYSVVSKFDEEGEMSSEGASFTQIVWKSTKQVGFGIAKSRSGKFYFVAEYYPSGNIRHQYEDNVFQLTDELLIKPLDCPQAVHSNTTRIRPTTTVRPVVVDTVDTEVVVTKPPKKVVEVDVVPTTTVTAHRKTTTEEEDEPVVVPEVHHKRPIVVETETVKEVVHKNPIDTSVSSHGEHVDVITLPTDYEDQVETTKPHRPIVTVTKTTSVADYADEEVTTVVKPVHTTTIAPEEDVEVVEEPKKAVKTTTVKPTVKPDVILEDDEPLEPKLNKVVEVTTRPVKVVESEEVDTTVAPVVKNVDVKKVSDAVVPVKKVDDVVVVKKTDKDAVVVTEKLVPTVETKAKRNGKAEQKKSKN